MPSVNPSPEQLAAYVAAMPAGVPVDGFGAFLEGLVPSTLHRLLGVRPDGSGRARHGPEQPLPHAVVIVDEASMVDVAMMRRLVDAVRDDARLILLGDRHQLASVEAGSVLADLCAPVIAAARSSSGGSSSANSSSGGSSSASPLSAGRRAGLVALGLGVDDVAEVARPGPWDGITLLRRSRRFAPDSGIGAFASACVEGAVERAVAVLALWPGGVVPPLPPGASVSDIGRLDPTPSGRVPAGLRDAIVASLAPTFEVLAQGPGADRTAWLEAVLAAFDRARVLCATRRGPLGVEGLNDAITGWLARRGMIDPSVGPWFVGRPVMVTRNDPSVGLYNGDIGLVVPAAAGADHSVRVVFAAEGGVVEHAPVRLPEHETVFAMTIHKSQGSEHDDVMIVLPPDVGPLLTRELVYTGVTRARSRVTVLAREETVRAALSRTVERATGLADRLAPTRSE